MGLLIDILRTASIYAVMAAGFVVVYRTSRVLNLAHPGLVMVGGYLAVGWLPTVTISQSEPWRFALMVVALLLLGAVIGAAIYYLFIRPMAGQSRISIIMMTLAMLFLLEAIAQFVWQGTTSFLPLPGNTVAYQALSTRIRLFDLVPIGVAALVFATVGSFYRRSRYGTQMRAIAENPALASRRGINIDRIGALSWSMAIILAFVASLLVGTQAPVSPLLVAVTLKGFTVSLVGGLDSLAAALPAALLVAASEILVVRFVDPQLGEAVPFVVLLVVLMVKPWGLAGTVEELDRV